MNDARFTRTSQKKRSVGITAVDMYHPWYRIDNGFIGWGAVDRLSRHSCLSIKHLLILEKALHTGKSSSYRRLNT